MNRDALDFKQAQVSRLGEDGVACYLFPLVFMLLRGFIVIVPVFILLPALIATSVSGSPSLYPNC